MPTREYPADQIPSYQELLARDPKRAPDTYHFQNRVDHGIADIPIDQYLSLTHHRREVDRMWKRVWQLAGFEIDLPKVGSFFTYDIAGISIIVTRPADGELAAFYNSCRHRSAALTREPAGHTKLFVCPFHGWTYQLDGTLSYLPAAWDFPHVCPGQDRIRPVQVTSLHGLIFVNLDPSAPSLESYLGPFPHHLKQFPTFERRLRTAWVRKIVPVNWKLAQEAFMEGYHLPTTHEQLAPGAPGYEMEYSVICEHVTRLTSAAASANWMSGPDIGEQEILDRMTTAASMPRIELREGQNARAGLADFIRGAMKQMAGLDLSQASDAEVVDSPLSYVFPNIVIWGGYAVPWVYRFRPNGDDPTTSIQEIFQMNPVAALPEGATHAPLHVLGPDEPFAAATELGYLGPVLDQDLLNMTLQQAGLRSNPDGVQRMGCYQESLIRHHLRTLGSYLRDE